MGKIRTKIIGAEDVEKEQAEKAKARREAKKSNRLAQDKSKKAKNNTSEDIVEEKKPVSEPEMKETSEKKHKKEQIKEVIAAKKTRGKKYLASKKMVDQKKKYSVKEAINLLKKMKYASFDESVELHLNVLEDNIKGEVILPAGTGKTVRVAIVDDDVITNIEAGKIDFDVLISTPQMMPKLVKFAKVLGPKGLMPNPKAGTVTDKPEEAVKKFQGGSIRYKTEPKFPLIHQTVGKMSFKDEDLIENTKSLLKAVGSKNITAAFISASMTPSVQIVVE